MIEKALRYLIQLGNNTEMQYEDDTWTTRQFMPVSYAAPEPIGVRTLESLVQFAREYNVNGAGGMFFRIYEPNKVGLHAFDFGPKHQIGMLGGAVAPEAAAFRYGQWSDPELFTIECMTKFVPSEGLNALLAYSGRIAGDSGLQLDDDGVTQIAALRKGVASKSATAFKNPVMLRPWRTFPELEQPESPFVFRMRGSADKVECTLFEATSPTWQVQAIDSIKVRLAELCTRIYGTDQTPAIV